jgi:hypothetical protein
MYVIVIGRLFIARISCQGDQHKTTYSTSYSTSKRFKEALRTKLTMADEMKHQFFTITSVADLY